MAHVHLTQTNQFYNRRTYTINIRFLSHGVQAHFGKMRNTFPNTIPSSTKKIKLNNIPKCINTLVCYNTLTYTKGISAKASEL